MPTIIRSAKEKFEIILNGDGSRYQDYLYIDDAVEMCYIAANVSESRIYLGASSIKTSNFEIASIISKFTGCEIKFVDEEKAHSFSFNPNETFETLKWKPKVDFKSGLIKMLG